MLFNPCARAGAARVPAAKHPERAALHSARVLASIASGQASCRLQCSYMFPVLEIPCLLRLATLKLTLGSYSFTRCLISASDFAEIKDVGVAVPDCAGRIPAKITSSANNPGRQDCFILIARTTRWAGAVLMAGQCWVLSVHCLEQDWQAQWPPAVSPLEQEPPCQWIRQWSKMFISYASA